jgi:TonB family protein
MNPLLIYLIKSGIALAAFYILYIMLLKGETFFRFNRYYLIAAILLSMVLPLLSVIPFKTTTGGALYSTLFEVATITDSSIDKAVAEKPGFVQMAAYFYLAVAALLLLRFLVRLGRLFHIIRNNGITTIENMKFVFTKENIAPFSFFNLIFLHRESKTDLDISGIIDHEKYHIREWHSLDIILVELLTVFQWFNPVVWQYRKSLKLLHEYLADERVLRQGINSIHYQNLLLTQSTGLHVSGITNNFNHSLIKNRIIMMTKTKSGLAARLKVLVAVPVALLLAIALTIGMSETATAQLVKEQKPSEEKQIMETPKVLMDEDEFFTVVDEMPRYPGGDEARMKFLVENIKYPEAARKAGKQGNVFVQFIVEADGKITNANVLRGFDDACDAMALKTIQAMPDWIPGKQDGKNVRVQFVMPIRFSLGNDSEEKKQE